MSDPTPTYGNSHALYALTLWQPWAWAICHAGKRIENRRWAPPRWAVGRDIAIHAGATRGQEQLMRAHPDWWPNGAPVPPAYLAHGAIVAVARLVGIVSESTDPWFCGPVGWTLDDVRVLGVPVPCRGAFKLWRVPDDVAAAVWRDVATQAAIIAQGR
jgi:hypothetical protein